MPKRKQHNQSPAPLLDEIRSIEAHCPEQASPAPASLCVLRVVPGLDAPAWDSLSLRHGLEHWCAVALATPTPRAELLARAIGRLAADAPGPDAHAFLRVEIERSRACGVPLALALIQPDTPATGSNRPEAALLQRLLELVLGLKRGFDHAAVLEGARLALVFSGASLGEAERMVGSMLRRIRTLAPGDVPQPGPSLLCSAGLAGYGGCVEITPDELIASAAQALASARSLGGNRLEVAAPVEVCLASRDTLVCANEKRFLFTGRRSGE